MIALVRLSPSDIDEMLSVECPLLVVLSGVQDPGNAGTIFRVADAFDASGCIGAEGTVHVYNDKLVRASAGSILRVPHCWGMNLVILSDRLRSKNIDIVGTAGDARIAIEDHDWRRPSAVLFGNEGAGLGSHERELCDTVVRIPPRSACGVPECRCRGRNNPLRGLETAEKLKGLINYRQNRTHNGFPFRRAKT